jgi:hypothetical protein
MRDEYATMAGERRPTSRSSVLAGAMGSKNSESPPGDEGAPVRRLGDPYSRPKNRSANFGNRARAIHRHAQDQGDTTPRIHAYQTVREHVVVPVAIHASTPAIS